MSTFPQPPVDPPDPPMECTWCDGGLVVAVGSIISPGGEIHSMELWAGDEIEIECPHCDGTGDEPPFDNPNVP